MNFPGALKSKFTTELDFSRASGKDAMPTYRILDQEGVIVDKMRDPPDLTESELVRMYKDMITGITPRARMLRLAV